MKLPAWLKMAYLMFGQARLTNWFASTLLHVPHEDLNEEAAAANVTPEQWRRVERQQADRAARLLVK